MEECKYPCSKRKDCWKKLGRGADIVTIICLGFTIFSFYHLMKELKAEKEKEAYHKFAERMFAEKEIDTAYHTFLYIKREYSLQDPTGYNLFLNLAKSSDPINCNDLLRASKLCPDRYKNEADSLLKTSCPSK